MSQEDMDIEMLTETEKSTIIDIEDYINDEASDINDFNFNEEFEHEALLQLIENHNNIYNQLIIYLGYLERIIKPYEGRDKKNMYGKKVNELYRLRTKINAIHHDNNKIINHLNKKLEEIGTNERVEKEDSRGSDDNVQHVFMFVCHAKEYNPTGERNLYPFENNAYESVGIFSTYGETAYVPMLNEKLMYNLNIHPVLDCDTMGVSIEDNKRFLTVNPLAMIFKFEDVNEPTAGPYMGLFYLKVKEIGKNNIQVIEMKHLIRFENTFEIAHKDINEINHNPRDPQSVHKIELHNDQTINSEFLDHVYFGWDVVLNVINRFYKEFLNNSDGDPQIHMDESVHIRIFCCRNMTEQVIGKGKGRYGGISLRDKTLFNVEEVANVQPDNTNMRYFWMTNEKTNNFQGNIHNFNNFIHDFLSQKIMYCEDRILIIYFLMLLDNDISNINLLLERLCTIFLDIEEKSYLSLLVMLSCNKTLYDMYKSKDIDITQYSSVSYDLNDDLNDDLNEQLKNHIISNIIGDCNKLRIDEGLKIYFMGTDKSDITLPYVLFIILENENSVVVSLNWINIVDQVENKIYIHNHETNSYGPKYIGDGIIAILEKFNNIEIIYNNNIQGKGGMNTGRSKYKKLDNNSMEDILNEMNPNRPLKLSSKYGRPYDVTTDNKYVPNEAIEQMKKFDERRVSTGAFNNPIYSLKNPVEEQTDKKDSQGTDFEFMTPVNSPNRTMTAPGSGYTDTEISPGDMKRGRPKPKRSVSPSTSTSTSRVNKGLTYVDSELPVSSIKSSPKSYEDLMELEALEALEALKAQKEMTTSVESLPGNKTDSDSEGYTQEEFGGKKKGKKGKKTKRAKKVKKTKKARKTKKKRSNKK